MPLRYLWDPWKAPKAVQEKAKCVIGIDYPHPMVEHNKASKECFNLMTEVKNKLEAGGEGNQDIVISNPKKSLISLYWFW